MSEHFGAEYPQAIAKASAGFPLQRIATADEVAGAILGLITGGDFVTGQTLIVDGGLSLKLNRWKLLKKPSAEFTRTTRTLFVCSVTVWQWCAARSSDEAYRIACAASGRYLVRRDHLHGSRRYFVSSKGWRCEMISTWGRYGARRRMERSYRSRRTICRPPTLELDLIPLCHKAGVACFPGAATPTEILARRAGADLVKIFPADLVGGPYFIRQMQGRSRCSFHGLGRGELGECSRIYSIRGYGHLSWQFLPGKPVNRERQCRLCERDKEFIKRVEEVQR
jgi:hypothetical protein